MGLIVPYSMKKKKRLWLYIDFKIFFDISYWSKRKAHLNPSLFMSNYICMKMLIYTSSSKQFHAEGKQVQIYLEATIVISRTGFSLMEPLQTLFVAQSHIPPTRITSLRDCSHLNFALLTNA